MAADPSSGAMAHPWMLLPWPPGIPRKFHLDQRRHGGKREANTAPLSLEVPGFSHRMAVLRKLLSGFESMVTITFQLMLLLFKICSSPT